MPTESLPRIVSLASGGGFLIAGFQTLVRDGEAGVLGRLDPESGELDMSFGSNGFAMHAVESDSFIGTGRTVLREDGGGYTVVSDWPALSEMIHFDSAGRVVSDFGPTGRVSLATERTHVEGLVIDGRNRPVVLLTHWVDSGTIREVRRYDEHGYLDGSFGTGGIVTLDGTRASFAQAIAHDPQADRLVACGWNEEAAAIQCARFWL